MGFRVLNLAPFYSVLLLNASYSLAARSRSGPTGFRGLLRARVKSYEGKFPLLRTAISDILKIKYLGPVENKNKA